MDLGKECQPFLSFASDVMFESFWTRLVLPRAAFAESGAEKAILTWPGELESVYGRARCQHLFLTLFDLTCERTRLGLLNENELGKWSL